MGGSSNQPPPSAAECLEAPKALKKRFGLNQLAPKVRKKILLPSAVHLEERLTVSQQAVSQAGSQSDSQSGKQAGRHTVWVFSVADSATSSGESNNCQNKQ